MTHNVACYRCGTSLAALSLPLSRQDECPGCQNYLHVCRMCVHFDPTVPRQCREDDADDVKEKARLNFCDYFVASEHAFDSGGKAAEDAARGALDSLFGGEAKETIPDSAQTDADKLFK
jgi:hypothetical protein